MPRKDLRGKRKRTRITSEILERMVDLRKRGFIYKEIAEKLGITLQTVAKYMRKEGLGGRGKKVAPEIVEEMREEKVEEKKEGKVGFVERLKRALGMK